MTAIAVGDYVSPRYNNDIGQVTKVDNDAITVEHAWGTAIYFIGALVVLPR